MLGCQDFCGYYDWTFAYVRKHFGQQAVRDLWSDAIGGDSQSHYLKAALEDGLRGLLRTWDKTGGDEHCDWTFTLDESRNVLRWDMRACPSKGFLLDHNLTADEDYCDHCMGWIVPLLNKAGIEVAAHEHNHCGQCWAEMRVGGKPYQTLGGRGGDIREDPRWQSGYIDRWINGVKTAVSKQVEQIDPVEVILDHVASAASGDRTIVTSSRYVTRDRVGDEPSAVVIEDAPEESHLDAIAERYNATLPSRQPLLLYTYLPRLDATVALPAFPEHRLPRPVPLLPLLIRAGVYRGDADAPRPSAEEFARMTAEALARLGRVKRS